MNLDIRQIENEIDYYGEDVTLRVNSATTFNDYGDESITTSDSTIKAFVNVLSQNDEIVKEGKFQSGDKTFFIKGDQTNLDRGNFIIHDSKQYKIDDVVQAFVGGTNYVYEVRTKKI